MVLTNVTCMRNVTVYCDVCSQLHQNYLQVVHIKYIYYFVCFPGQFDIIFHSGRKENRSSNVFDQQLINNQQLCESRCQIQSVKCYRVYCQKSLQS